MRSTWLDKAVPVRLGDEMDDFRRIMARVLAFAETLDSLGWAGSEDFREWADNCAKIWLGKRKEYCLDWVRNRLAFGTSPPNSLMSSGYLLCSRVSRPFIISDILSLSFFVLT